MSFTITAVNDAPVAIGEGFTVSEDAVLTGSVLDNDGDVEGNPLTAVLVAGPNHGTLALNADGSFTYTPIGNFNGADSFTYKANDGTADSNIVTVSFTITAVNDAPVAVSGLLTLIENMTATETLSATDVDDRALTFSVVSTSNAHGTVSLTNATTGAYTYSPDADFNGDASFTFQVSDRTVDSNTATVTITVKGIDKLFVSVPVETPESSLGGLSENNQADWKFLTGAGTEETPTFQLGATYNEGSGWSGVVSAAAEAIGGKLLEAFLSSGGQSNPFANLPQNQTTTEDEQILYGDTRDNNLSLNHKQSVGLGGRGKDDFKQSANYTTAYGNEGADTFTISAKNATSVGGPGSDTYKPKPGTVNGKILDTSPDGTIDLSDVSWPKISMALDGGDLKVLTEDGRSLKLIEFSAFQRDGWTVKTSDGSYSIENALRIPKIDAARVALAAYDGNPDDLSQFGLKKRPREINDVLTGLQATVYDRVAIPSTSGDLVSSGAKLPPGHVVVGVAGTNEILDVTEYPFGFEQVGSLLDELNQLGPINNLTLVGHSLSGTVNTFAGFAYAFTHPDVIVNVVALDVAV